MAESEDRQTDRPTDFEATLRELATLVEQLEAQDIPLDEALAAFERGIDLSRQAMETLNRAEQRLQVLLADGEDPVPEIPQSDDEQQ